MNAMARLLIMEDNQNDGLLLMRKLAPSFLVDWEMTLVGGLNRLAGQQYDSVLLDIGLPGSDRETVVQTVKQHSKPSAVVVLSGYTDPDFIRKSIMDSASNYLIKGMDDQDADVLAGSIRLAIKNNEACRKVESEIERETTR